MGGGDPFVNGLQQHRYAAMLGPDGHYLARRLVVNIIAQALLDSKSRDYYRAQQALAWLNRPEAKALADWIELAYPPAVTPATVERLHRFRLERQEKVPT